MKNLKAVFACSTLALMVAGCGEAKMDITYHSVERRDGVSVVTADRLNDNVTLTIQEGKAKPKVSAYKCSDRTSIERDNAQAKNEYDQVMAESVDKMKVIKLDQNGMEQFRSFTRQIELNRTKLSGMTSVIKACDLSFQ